MHTNLYIHIYIVYICKYMYICIYIHIRYPLRSVDAIHVFQQGTIPSATRNILTANAASIHGVLTSF